MKSKIIGLTGGIGSGKTTIAKIFESLGVPIYIADVEAKRIMQSVEIEKAIKVKFGEQVFNNHSLDRALLSKIVFENPQKLSELNDIVHPAVASDFDEWVDAHQNHPFVIKESAILFETNAYKNCFKTILVTAPLETRIQRVIKRDQANEKDIKRRIQNQWDDDKKIPLADYIIQNTDDCDLFNIVSEIIKSLNNL
jgi:dephospho-CoA kinase